MVAARSLCGTRARSVVSARLEAARSGQQAKAHTRTEYAEPKFFFMIVLIFRVCLNVIHCELLWRLHKRGGVKNGTTIRYLAGLEEVGSVNSFCLRRAKSISENEHDFSA